MTKKIRKSLLITSLLATSFFACGVAAMNNVSAKAETADFATAFGASVRVSDPNGIRFKLQLSEEKKNEIFAENSGKELGMYIMLGSKAGTDYSALTQKIDIEFEENDLYKVGDYWYANGVMTDLYIQSFNKEFVGVGYVATTTGETTTYEYSDFNITDNVRSMSYVAIEAYKDPEAAAHKDSMAKLIEKAAYADYGVTETRTTVGDEIVYEFNAEEGTWASYAAMKEQLPIYLSVAQEEASLMVGDTLDLNAALAVNGTDIDTLDIPFTYSVDTEGVVTLEDGVVSAYAAGTTNVTVSFGNFEKTVAINVSNPADVIVNTNSAAMLNNVKTVKGAGTHEVAYSKDVKMGEDKGSLQFTCLTDGDGYLQITNPLITNVSAYDYFEFQINNPTNHSVYVAVTWVTGITIQAGQTGTLKITASDFGSYTSAAGICTPAGNVMLSTDITNIRFYVKNLVETDSIYFSSFKGVKSGVVAAENVIVDTNSVNSVNSFIIKDQAKGALYGTHSLAWSDEVRYGDEAGSIKVTCTKAGAPSGLNNGSEGYLMLSNPMLLKDISAYDYVEFKVYIPKGSHLRLSWVWASASVPLTDSADTDETVSDSDWYTFRVNVSEFTNNKVENPFVSGQKVPATNITNFSVFVREMAEGDTFYISSFKAGKNA